MGRKNCWEVMDCGRQPGGEDTQSCGACSATLPREYEGVNGGNHGGRFCWAIAGTLCGGEPQGTYSRKIVTCLRCGFLKQVEVEEGRSFVLTPQKAISVHESERETRQAL